jgi:cytidylate kinase
MAGRDIGTVVLPDAPVKIFLTASVARERGSNGAELELAERGVTVDPRTLRAEIEERDRLDAGRPTGPLRPAPDALEIDSSGLSGRASRRTDRRPSWLRGPLMSLWFYHFARGSCG